MHLIRAFKFAFAGIAEAFRNEKNMKIHSLLTIFALILAIVVKLSPTEWAILILTIGLVFAMEFVNTSIEAFVDLVSPEIKEKAKLAKDVGAAAVLTAAIVAVLVACFLFLPKIF